MSEHMRKVWAYIADAYDPSKAINAVVDVANKAEEKVVTTGVDLAKDHGVISEDTAQSIKHAEQVAQGIRQGVGDLAGGALKAAVNPIGTTGQLVAGAANAYTKGGGGVDGAIDAVNTINPLYHAAVSGIQGYQAIE